MHRTSLNRGLPRNSAAAALQHSGCANHLNSESACLTPVRWLPARRARVGDDPDVQPRRAARPDARSPRRDPSSPEPTGTSSSSTTIRATDTRADCRIARETFPVQLRYVFERAQGRSHALNTGITVTTAPVLVFTDDDVLVDERGSTRRRRRCWPIRRSITRAVRCGRSGRVRDQRGSRPIAPDLWGTIAICNYGDEAFVSEERRRVPLRREHGGRDGCSSDRPFDGTLGRSNGRQLLGQEVPELLARARAAGARGLYRAVDGRRSSRACRSGSRKRTPAMVVWKGLSRARLDSLRPLTEAGRRSPAGAPLRGASALHVADCSDAISRLAHGDVRQPEQFRHEAMLCYFAGYLGGRRHERGTLQPAVAR